MATLMTAPPTDRVGRYPKHTFQTTELPFVATPFMLARVLPGETVQNLFMESRVITTPILSPIIGWKKEYFFFYVKITDLLNDEIRDMFIDPANDDIADNAAPEGGTYGIAANSTTFYAAKGGINWMQRALKRVVATYFRDEGDETVREVGGLPLVQIRESTFLDSITAEADMPEGADLADATTVGDLERLLDAYEGLRALGLANMTYEDWLRSNGITIPGKDENRPELLSKFSEFQYPSNTVDPTTGIPASAVSWVFKNGDRKPKFFKEPGFVIGISITRPKIYFAGLAGSAAGFAGRAWDWMPNYLRNMPETTLKPFVAGTGPLGDRTTDPADYFLDMRDELIHGDQFQNRTAFNGVPANVGAQHLLALPTSTLNFKYPDEAMCRSFFVTPASGGVLQDGYVSLSVKGHEIDYTRGNIAEG